MKSIISHLNSQNFSRLRIGIGKPKDAANDDNTETVSHVLGKFSATESKLMNQVLDFVVDCVELTFKQGVEKAMNRCNSWTPES
jgi:PTH1 family peptidyl-tRNA hydrolase